MENMTIILGVVMFSVVVIGLVTIILAARSKLVSTGDVTITINDNPDQSIKVAAGGKLMNTLADAGIYLPSACGGGGSCQQCRCIINSGVETSYQLKRPPLPRAKQKKAGACLVRSLLSKT